MIATKGRRLLKVREATKYLEKKLGRGTVTEKGLRAWIAQRRIPVLKVGGLIFLTPEALDAMIEERPAAR